MVMITGTGSLVSGRYTSALNTSPSSMRISTSRSMIVPSGTLRRVMVSPPAGRVTRASLGDDAPRICPKRVRVKWLSARLRGIREELNRGHAERVEPAVALAQRAQFIRPAPNLAAEAPPQACLVAGDVGLAGGAGQRPDRWGRARRLPRGIRRHH